MSEKGKLTLDDVAVFKRVLKHIHELMESKCQADEMDITLNVHGEVTVTYSDYVSGVWETETVVLSDTILTEQSTEYLLRIKHERNKKELIAKMEEKANQIVIAGRYRDVMRDAVNSAEERARKEYADAEEKYERYKAELEELKKKLKTIEEELGSQEDHHDAV